jgi:anaerobic selenocysteine-containing dehydrogenase
MPDSDFDNTNCIVLWGYNPANTALPTFARRIMKAKQRGAKLIVIDPRFSQTAAKQIYMSDPDPALMELWLWACLMSLSAFPN